MSSANQEPILPAPPTIPTVGPGSSLPFPFRKGSFSEHVPCPSTCGSPLIALQVLQNSINANILLDDHAKSPDNLGRILVLENVSADGRSRGSRLDGSLDHLEDGPIGLHFGTTGDDDRDMTSLHHLTEGIGAPRVGNLHRVRSQFGSQSCRVFDHLHLVLFLYLFTGGINQCEKRHASLRC